ncbi:MAG: hypothetical protein CBE01_000445 [Planctomycetaceae bacterium TMED241]|nr:hypothetical protein [Synechococcus sp. BS301-5m-G54]MBL6795590.1 hypothetical protein [Synechococcus sp. BS307-5m-G34]RCL54234.1 MAG: hypothetical protein DBW84_04975 [Synechococcus sp. MED-G70]RPG08916.1 MAG: hypothetical protein CBE01_005495 [Planctomycetaceae bacterium TMED241]HCX54616.1 hypothetical protein [Synechococcus sp. UBA9887]
MVGVGCALWWHGWENHQAELPAVISDMLAEPEPPPPPPPPREDLVRFHPERNLDLLRPDGTNVSIGYHSAVVDPRWIDVEFFGGWNREMDANEDTDALLFTSGPTFARGRGNGELGMRLHGDLMLANGTWRAGNLTAARERAWMGITRDGALEFGYGPLTPELEQNLRMFIGGLHAFTNTTRVAPETYEGVYGEMHLADVRIVYGLRADGKLELVETADGVHFRDLKHFVEQKGFLAAYLPDHASKSRLIIPGTRPWSQEQAVWVSGGKPSITQMPFLLRVTPTREWVDHQLPTSSEPEPAAQTN